MASTSQPPLDELAFSEPGFIQYWVDQGGRPMDENMIHRYLEISPYFDHTTKNGIAFDHALRNGDPRALQYIADRKLLEQGMRAQIGTEYMIIEDPKPAKDAQLVDPAGTTGVYVIRKQDRQKVQNFDGRTVEELTTLESYYTLGHAMFKAASVADTVGNRLLLAQRHIQAFVDAANELPSFDSAMGGHYYLRPSNKPAAAAGSTPGTPSHSREGSVAAGGDAHSVRSGSVELGTQAGGDPSAAALEDRLLRESLGMSLQFGDEYMDENPIIGEPGKFCFTSSTAAVRQRKEAEKAAEAKAKAAKEAKSVPTSPKAAPAPPTIMTEAKATKDDKDRKSGKTAERVRRKKSKGNALSPTTPGAGPSSSL